MSGLKNSLRIGTLLLSGLVPSVFAADASAQGTSWAPSRSASRPNDGASYTAEPSQPDWQRTPASNERFSPSYRPSSNVRASGNFAPQYSSQLSARRVSHDEIGYPSRTSNNYSGANYAPSQRGSTQRMNYDVQLGPGEKLVGQPTYTENGPSPTPVASSRARHTRLVADEPHKPEHVPTPDGVSSEPMLPAPMIRGTQPQEGEMNLEPGFSYEDGQFEGDMVYDDHGGMMQGDCESCVGGDCDSCTGGCGGGMGLRDEWADPRRCSNCGCYGYHRFGCGRVAMCLHNCLGPIVREWSLFTGVQGFKGPLDGGNNGNFGFNEGFNLAGPIIPWPRIGLGYQIGGRFAQSNLSGSPFNTSARDQAFATVGLFHRAYRNCGFQWGFVYDWMTDNYQQKETYGQMRAEMSWIFPRGNEFGFLGMFGVKNTNNNQLVPVTQADMYNMFFRHTTEWGGQGRIWAGMTNHSLAILGSDFRVPLSNRMEMVGGFNYIIPNDGNQQGLGGGFTQESWGISLNMVWYIGRPKQGVHNTPFRPLFNVADNNVMMFERQ